VRAKAIASHLRLIRRRGQKLDPREITGGDIKTALNANPYGAGGEGPARLVALGLMSAGVRLDIGTVIEIAACAIHMIERGLDWSEPDAVRFRKTWFFFERHGLH
jgi:hypothetical protein